MHVIFGLFCLTLVAGFAAVLYHESAKPAEYRPPSQAPSLVSLRRAEARRWLRERGIIRVRAVY